VKTNDCTRTNVAGNGKCESMRAEVQSDLNDERRRCINMEEEHIKDTEDKDQRGAGYSLQSARREAYQSYPELWYSIAWWSSRISCPLNEEKFSVVEWWASAHEFCVYGLL